MSETELAPVVLAQAVTAPSAAERNTSTSSSLRPRDTEGGPVNSMRMGQELAPVDGGAAAWKLLCAAFMFEALLWGKS